MDEKEDKEDGLRSIGCGKGLKDTVNEVQIKEKGKEKEMEDA